MSDLEYLSKRTNADDSKEELRRQCVRLAYALLEGGDDKVQSELIKMELYKRVYMAQSNIHADYLDTRVGAIITNTANKLREKDIKGTFNK